MFLARLYTEKVVIKGFVPWILPMVSIAFPIRFAAQIGRNILTLPLDKAGVKQLKAKRQELTEQNESLRPKLGQIRAELDQLSKLRYWTQKAIPDTLPEREDFEEQMEVRENRRELERVMDAAIEAVTQETEEQPPVTERPTQEKDHER